MLQQTAMEKLFINLELIDITINKGVKKVFLEIEKEQISEAYRTGVEEDVYNNPLKTGEQYYNETFKKL